MEQDHRHHHQLRDILPADREDVEGAGAPEILLDFDRDLLAVADQHSGQEIGHARIVLQPDLQTPVGPVAGPEREGLPPVARVRRDDPPVRRCDRGAGVNSVGGLPRAVIEFARRESGHHGGESGSEFDPVAATQTVRGTDEDAADIALCRLPRRVDLSGEEPPASGTPRLHAEDEAGAVECTTGDARDQLRWLLDDKAAPLSGGESLFFRQETEIVRRNGGCEQQRMGEPGANRESVEGDEGKFFPALHPQPHDSGEDRQGQRDGPGGDAIQREETPRRKRQADRKEGSAQRPHGLFALEINFAQGELFGRVRPIAFKPAPTKGRLEVS